MANSARDEGAPAAYDQQSAVDPALFVMHRWFVEKGDGEPNLRWWDHNRALLTRLFDEMEALGWVVRRTDA